MVREQGESNKDSFVVVRTSEEIGERAAELQQLIDGHDVWIHTGVGKVPKPEARRKTNILEAKLSEIRWLQGEDVSIEESLQD